MLPAWSVSSAQVQYDDQCCDKIFNDKHFKTVFKYFEGVCIVLFKIFKLLTLALFHVCAAAQQVYIVWVTPMFSILLKIFAFSE